jgi:hypothetical protein
MGRIEKSLAVAAAAAALLTACNLLHKDATPTEPTEVTVVTPVTIPVILPKASPTPTPTPKPTPTPVPGNPTPTPTPTPDTPPPTGGSCKLPPTNSPDAPCRPESQSFLSEVDQAITTVTKQHPEWFDFNDKKCENCYYVKNPGRVSAAVIAQLSAMGLCALDDGEELAVKSTNSFNDQYDILLSSGHLRRGSGSYRTTCRPSWF